MAGLTADIVLLRFKKGDKFFKKKVEVLLIQRKDDPYKNEWALPGGYVNADKELIIDAAVRELREETGVVLKSDQLEFISYYDAVNRDPRGRTITLSFLAFPIGDVEVKAGDDAKDYKWIDIDDRPIIAFDHAVIIADALERFYGRQR